VRTGSKTPSNGTIDFVFVYYVYTERLTRTHDDERRRTVGYADVSQQQDIQRFAP